MTGLDPLIAAVGRENAIENDPSASPSPAKEGAPSLSVAGRQPRIALFPASLEALSDLMSTANREELAVAPYGGGTQIGIGAPPSRLDALVMTRRLDRLVDYQADDLTVTVEAGMTIAELQRTLAGRRQFLPLDPPLPERATVGGTVAANASGPWRAGFGTARDWLIGCRVVSADGQLVKGGGRVVKNVAGYDLCKLYTGSLGTLGVLAELTFKVLPRPETWAAAGIPLPWPEIEPLLAEMTGSDLAPTALELFDADADPSGVAPEGGAALLVRFEGPREAVEWQLATLEAMTDSIGAGLPRALSESLWERVRDWTAGPWQWLGAAGTLSSEVAGLMEAARRWAATAALPLETAARAASGVVFFGARDPITAEQARELTTHLRDEAIAHGGSLVVLDAAPELRDGLDVWGPLGPELQLMQGIKAQLDPKGILNPGRFVGGI